MPPSIRAFQEGVMFVLESHDTSLVFRKGDRLLRVLFLNEETVRVTMTEGRPFRPDDSPVVVATARFEGFRLEETEALFRIATPRLVLEIRRDTGAITFLDGAGRVLSAEAPEGGRRLEPRKIFRNVFDPDAALKEGSNVDGARSEAEVFETVFDRDAFAAELHLRFGDDEAIFGLGSHEEGYGNLRGKSRELYQQNLKITVPFLISTRGYGILFDCGSAMTFRDSAGGAVWRADAVDEFDTWFLAGGDTDAVMRNLHQLTGAASLLPKWAFGFVQSKERYVNAHELIETVDEHRRRNIPLDLIVLDWRSWPDGNDWGQKSFDPVRFPDPKAMTDALHARGAKLMVSIWPILTGAGADRAELRRHRAMLGNQSTYDAFDPKAREIYWNQAERGLFRHGVDAWWCDCSEPFEADWQGAEKPEPLERMERNTALTKRYIDPSRINLYSLFHSMGIHDGQRAASADKRVLNLTRSGFSGQHRYGTVCWNGDISGTWETLRRCIPEGVNFCASGEPYWTVDIGGFFVARDPRFWFWNGDHSQGARGLYPTDVKEPVPESGSPDPGYHELYVRWLQYAVFLPMTRSHGTDVPREIWRFGEEGDPFYDALAKFIRLRSRLVPYIYSLAAKVTSDGTPMLRATALGFPDDRLTHDQTESFLFGSAFLVRPVTRPMYFEKDGVPIPHLFTKVSVHLPAGAEWHDFWTGEVHRGGRSIEVDAPIDRMPLFVRSGSIVPLTEPLNHVGEKPDAPWEIRVYEGADGEFTLYEDEGDGYGHEKGESSRIPMAWNETKGELTLGARMGSFQGMCASRPCRILFHSAKGLTTRDLIYTGSPVRVAH